MGEVGPVKRWYADDPWEAERGEWVRYEDHAGVVAALEADVERLKRQGERGGIDHSREVERLRAEVESLRAAAEISESIDATHMDRMVEIAELRAEVERLRDENGRIAVDHYDAIRANGRLVRDHTGVCAKLDDALTLLGECASYDYGSSWPAYLRRRVDAILDRAATNNEEPGSVATDAGRAIPTPASPGSSPSTTDAVVEAARHFLLASFRVYGARPGDYGYQNTRHVLAHALNALNALDAARKEGGEMDARVRLREWAEGVLALHAKGHGHDESPLVKRAQDVLRVLYALDRALAAPQPERPSLADDPEAVERVKEAAGKAYSRMIHHAAEAVRMRAPDHLTATRKAVAAAEWCENYARDLALTIRRDADALSAALRAAERKGGE